MTNSVRIICTGIIKRRYDKMNKMIHVYWIAVVFCFVLLYSAIVVRYEQISQHTIVRIKPLWAPFFKRFILRMYCIEQ